MTGVRTARAEAGGTVELYLNAQPDGAAAGFEDQALSMYARLGEALREQGASPRDLVAEKIFLTEVAVQAPRLGALRRQALGLSGGGVIPPATSRVQQPPAHPGRHCELLALALVNPGGISLAGRAIDGLPSGASGRVVEADGLRHVFLAGLTGGSPGDGLDVPGQASSMFAAADGALARAGLAFGDVVRTWICLPEIDRDYGDLNRARRDFFRAEAVDPPPASTGIGGMPFPPDRACGLDLRAIGGEGKRRVTRLRSEGMNEAPSYGADFARGTRVDLAGRALVFISGTASIDREGRVVHPGDLGGQADRALSNVEALLAGAGARYSDVVCATTYLKAPAREETFRRVAERRGLPGSVPHVVCIADICRPEWLCEVEVTAILR
jgi:enamine deaminase RidA (YjgF/YER057c/UK114 family)